MPIPAVAPARIYIVKVWRFACMHIFLSCHGRQANHCFGNPLGGTLAQCIYAL